MNTVGELIKLQALSAVLTQANPRGIAIIELCHRCVPALDGMPGRNVSSINQIPWRRRGRGKSVGHVASENLTSFYFTLPQNQVAPLGYIVVSKCAITDHHQGTHSAAFIIGSLDAYTDLP